MDPLIGYRVVYILGIVNLVTGVLVFLSCRCIPGAKLAAGLMKYKKYQRFYKYHCHFWRVFWPAVIVHAIFAIIFFGVPFGLPPF